MISWLTEENLKLKKKSWGDLKKKWVEPDIRDEIVEWIMKLKEKKQVRGRKK